MGFLKDLNNSTSKLSAILFADDTNLFCSSKDLQELESVVNTELTNFFFASCGSLFPFTRAKAQWVIHGFM